MFEMVRALEAAEMSDDDAAMYEASVEVVGVNFMPDDEEFGYALEAELLERGFPIEDYL